MTGLAHDTLRISAWEKADLDLLICLPALNEERTIAEVIEAIPENLPGIGCTRVLVVNDGSSDGTVRRAIEAGADVVSHHRPRGVGAAFHTALRHGIQSGSDLIVTIDSDGQFDPRDIPLLIDPIVAGDADFVTASRFKDAALTPKMTWVKRWGNAMMSRLISRLTGHKFYDVSCGFRCYGPEAVLNLHLMGRFTYTQEVFMNLAFKQLRIVEVPVPVRGIREHGKSRVAGNLITYAMNTSRIVFRCYRDYHPLRFFGSIALMLMLPGLALESFLLWHYLRTGVFTPYKWVGFAGAALFILGLLMSHMGIIGDMLNRHRVYLEELLYYRRVENSGRQRLEARYPRDDEGDAR